MEVARAHSNGSVTSKSEWVLNLAQLSEDEGKYSNENLSSCHLDTEEAVGSSVSRRMSVHRV